MQHQLGQASYQIAAVAVNHNTSRYMELMLRSLLAHHPDWAWPITVFDNASEDDMADLRAYVAQQGLQLRQSGFATNTRNNSHGEILRRFVLDNPHCTHYLFLDADVCFLENDSIPAMLIEVERDPTAFGIGPRLSWDGINAIPDEVWQANPDIGRARLHPCCALVKNSPLFRRVVEEIGLSAVNYLWAMHDEYLDTFKLMTRVMHTHGLQHITSSKMIVHFFAVSYRWDDTATREHKARLRDHLLGELKGAGDS